MNFQDQSRRGFDFHLSKPVFVLFDFVFHHHAQRVSGCNHLHQALRAERGTVIQKGKFNAFFDDGLNICAGILIGRFG